MDMAAVHWRISIVGCGGLGGALARGLMRAGVPPGMVTLCDKDTAKCEALGTGALVTADARQAAGRADVVVVAVKPAHVVGAMDLVGEGLLPDGVVVSAAAGVTLKTLRGALGTRGALVRAMPNVNVAVASSETALCAEPDGPVEAVARAEWLFGCVGSTVVLDDEKLLDAATAVAASAPAFMAVVLEALMDGGVKAGLTRAAAAALVLGMAEGTARHLRQRELHPGQLKDMVMSPAGTTAAGLERLEEHAVRGALMAAVSAAVARARELRGA
jgi:pyrroline-5-carboxylate reductase